MVSPVCGHSKVVVDLNALHVGQLYFVHLLHGWVSAGLGAGG